MTTKFHAVWIGDDNPFFKLHLGQIEDHRLVWLDRDSIQERLGGIARYGDTFEDAITKLSIELRRAADSLLVFAKDAQRVMDSGEVTMAPMERSTAAAIGQFIRGFARGEKPSDDNQELHDLAYRIEQGEWRDPR